MTVPTADEAEAYALAIRWLKELEGQVHRLRDDQRMWERLQGMIAANPALHRPNDFYRWMRDMYVAGMAMAIRRLVDDHDQAISFVRFLKLVKQFPGVVSRARYRRLFDDDDCGQFEVMKRLNVYHAYVEDGYDSLVGSGKATPDPQDVHAEISSLRKLTKRLIVFATKVIAHTDEAKPTNLPTFAEVAAVVDRFEVMVKRYVALTRAATLTIGSNAQYDINAIFRVPWIAPKR